MKVLGLVGSPRIGGNTEILVSEVLRGAEESGASVERIALNNLNISGCQGCDVCRKLKRCRLQDDMQPLYDKLLAADALVLGTPIYFWGPSAQLKAFVDRWYALDQEGIREGLERKRVLLVCAFADADPETARFTVGMMRTGTEWLKMRFLEPVLAIASDRGEVAGKPEYMSRAYEAGRALFAG